MKLDQARIIEIGREIVTGTGIGAHVYDGISHHQRQAVDMFRIPGVVVPNLAATGECRSIGKAKNQNCSADCRKTCVRNPHADLPPCWKAMHNIIFRTRFCRTLTCVNQYRCCSAARRRRDQVDGRQHVSCSRPSGSDPGRTSRPANRAGVHDRYRRSAQNDDARQGADGRQLRRPTGVSTTKYQPRLVARFIQIEG